MKSFIRFAFLALVLVMVALVSALTAMRFAIHGQEVAVPGVIGMSPAEADRAVAGLGLQIEIERQYYSPQDAGFKLGNVTVAGPQESNAEAAPTEPPVAPSATPPQPTPASIVVSQNPAAGQKVVAGAVVSFEVR